MNLLHYVKGLKLTQIEEEKKWPAPLMLFMQHWKLEGLRSSSQNICDFHAFSLIFTDFLRIL